MKYGSRPLSEVMRSTSPPKGRDYPRMCGEHPTEHVFVREAMGSSPHVRGARPKLLVTSTGDGIIPACAGSTAMQRR